MIHKNKSSRDNFKKIFNILKDLNEKYPTQGVARHISDATTEYHNLWLLGDKELLFALTKYKEELDLNTIDEKEIDQIYNDGLNLESMDLTDDIDWEEENG